MYKYDVVVALCGRASAVAEVEVVGELPRLIESVNPRIQNDFTGVSERTMEPKVIFGGDDGILTEEKTIFSLDLLNESRKTADFIQLVLLYDTTISRKQWIKQLVSSQYPETFFADGGFDVCADASTSYRDLSCNNNHPSFQSSCADQFEASILPPCTSPVSPRRVKAMWSPTLRNVSFHHLGLSTGETLRIPIQASKRSCCDFVVL